MALVVAAGAIGLAACAATAPEPSPTPAVDRFHTPASLRSYRYTVELKATTELLDTSEAPAGLNLDGSVLEMRIEGARVNPDREQARAMTTFGYLSLDRETIVIGDGQWSRQENGAWRRRPPLTSAEDFLAQSVALTPSVILGTDDPEYLTRLKRNLDALPHTFEEVNGRQTRHWTFDDEGVRTYLMPIESTIPGLVEPSTVQVDVWTDTETGVAVRLILMAGTAEEPDAFALKLNLLDVNDPEIVVEPPADAIGD